MSVISILRDATNNVSLVRMIVSDALATVASANYIANQMVNIRALNNGSWQWYISDILVVSASDGNALFEFTDSTFASLNQMTQNSGGPFLPLAGGTMSGAIRSAATPAAFSQINQGYLYVDLSASGFISPIDSNFCFNFKNAGIVLSDNVGLVASNYPRGFTFAIKNVSAGNGTFTPFLGDLIDGNASLTIGSQRGVVIAVTSDASGNLTWSTIAESNFGSGIINPGLINQLAWYAAAGSVISGLATVNNSSLSTNATGVPTWLALGAGQIVIGSAAGAPAAATISAGTGISVTNGNNTISIASNGANPWVDQTTASVTMAINTGYTTDNGASLVTYTLPTNASIGDWVEVNGKSSGQWKIAQAASQQIFFGTVSTTAGVGGSLSSSNQYDCVRLRALTSGATSTWVVVSAVGNLSYV